VRKIVRLLLAKRFAYGAGWTDRERQQSVGDTGRTEPRHVDAIVGAELERALADPDLLRGIAQLVSRWSAAFLLDPDGLGRSNALGAEWAGAAAARCAARRQGTAARRGVGRRGEDTRREAALAEALAERSPMLQLNNPVIHRAPRVTPAAHA
jgi:hypothetical protein